MFDLAIIGGGPAGYTAAERAAQANLKVVIFEQNSLGGTCLNVGCIPTKTLLYSSKLFYNAKNSIKYGINAEVVSFDYDKIVSRKNKVVRKLVAGVKARMKHENITLIDGYASVIDNDNETITILCNDEQYQAAKLLICTGSQVSVPPIPGLDKADYWTSTEALNTKEIPKSLIIIGGGVIGIEFAGLFNTFGTKVTVIEMAPEILPGIDSEISAILREDLTKKGIEFHLSSKVLSIDTGSVIYSDSEGEHNVEATNILLCVGRKPNLKGLENLHLEPNRNGIKVDDHMLTSSKNVWAAGDVTAFSLLAHTAVREAEVAVNNIIGHDDSMHYNAIPGVIYTNPEVAGCGVTEDHLKTSNTDYLVYKLPMTYSGRFVAENEGFMGLCKIITDTSNRLIGVHMIGNPSSEIISTASIAIELNLSIEQFKKIIFPHPTVSEIFKETISK